MLLRLVCTTLLAGSLALPAAAAELDQVYRGTTHDALYGLCLDGQEGIAVGGAGLVLESGDGGQNWAVSEAFTSTALLDVSCGAGVSLIVSQGGGIFRWSDGAYQAVESGSDARLMSVASNNNGLAFAVGSFGAILRSQDGGESWETVPYDWEAVLNDFVEPHLYDVDVSDSGVVTIIGEFELVVRSPDGGETWETAHTGEASLFGLDLNAAGAGFAVGQDGKIIRTEDGGVSWADVESPTGGILLSVWSSPEGEVLISGIRSLLRSGDDGASWELVEGGDLNTGWYQGLVVTGGDSPLGESVLLAGHQGSVIKVELN